MDSAQTAPPEFTKAAVAEASKNAQTPYRDFYRSGEPYTSLMQHNPWLRPPRPDEVLQYGEGRYFDTTVAEKHDYWRDKNLPSPTKDLAQLRSRSSGPPRWRGWPRPTDVAASSKAASLCSNG